MEAITERAADKQFLQAIVDNNNYIPDDIDYFLFLKALLQNFASTDPQLVLPVSFPFPYPVLQFSRSLAKRPL